VVERSVLLEDGTELGPEGLHLDSEDEQGDDQDLQFLRWLERVLTEPIPADGLDLDLATSRLEAALIRKALAAAGNNQSQAARLLRLGRDRLRYRLRSHQLPGPAR
jgi:DNA-binding NtrC family response regulator